MIKWFGIALGSLVALAVAFILLVAIVNSFDTDLRPDVAAILAKKETFTDTQKRAFFYVLGAQSGDTENPETKGAELWEKRQEPGFWTSVGRKGFKATAFESCDRKACGSAALEANPALADYLKSDAVALKQWIDLMNYGEGGTIFRGDANTPIGMVSALPLTTKLNDLMHLQMAVWLKRGGEVRVVDLLTQSNRYMQSFLKQGSLLERMLAGVFLSRNAAFLRDELMAYPKMPVTPELLDSMRMPKVEDVLFGALETELQIVANAINSIGNLEGLEKANFTEVEVPSQGGGLARKIPATFVLKRNDTLNHIYDINTQTLTTDCPSGMDWQSCVPATAWLELKYPWQWVNNPVGKALAKILTVSSFMRRRDKMVQQFQEIDGIASEIRAKR